jgi:hypothetical protein
MSTAFWDRIDFGLTVCLLPVAFLQKASYVEICDATGISHFVDAPPSGGIAGPKQAKER